MDRSIVCFQNLFSSCVVLDLAWKGNKMALSGFKLITSSRSMKKNAFFFTSARNNFFSLTHAYPGKKERPSCTRDWLIHSPSGWLCQYFSSSPRKKNFPLPLVYILYVMLLIMLIGGGKDQTMSKRMTKNVFEEGDKKGEGSILICLQ